MCDADKVSIADVTACVNLLGQRAKVPHHLGIISIRLAFTPYQDPPRTPRPRAWYHLGTGKPILKLVAPRLENAASALAGAAPCK